ncbi:hypothetical protein IGI04_005431 [Brassica rapa subsp. trilocularis]|uniref:DUF295 domain-containing protein n=1 Tax=Brassica rapa subsp. trilocularis TaxID=1813537 RepID=A0ABQ7NE03_BRACM|nr:hypothetical protein IGI04_005431 [Brassica rapa subsp. trilocularis]
MALVLNRILKLHARRDNARFFSSLPESPYLLLGGKKLRDSPEGQVGKHMFFDPTKEEKVYISEKTVPQELNGQPLLGASQSWVALPCTSRISSEFLLYSRRNKTFYFTSFKGLFMGSLDISNKKLKFQDLRLRTHFAFAEDGEWIMMHSITKRFTSEAFCLSASMYSGPKPNSIYYIGSGLGYYNLASGTVRSFDPLSGKPLLVRYPYWLHPTNPIA